MPEGQFLGTRGDYVYENDAGETYKLELDDTLAGLVGTSLVPFDPAVPGDASPPPRRFKPRIVYWEATAAGFEGKRKAIVCGAADAALYQTDQATALEIDGVAGITTGRRGEKLTF